MILTKENMESGKLLNLKFSDLNDDEKIQYGAHKKSAKFYFHSTVRIKYKITIFSFFYDIYGFFLKI